MLIELRSAMTLSPTVHCHVATAIPGGRVWRRGVVGVSKGLDREAGHHHGLLGLGQVTGGLLAGDGAGKQGLVLELETKAI